MSKPNVLVQILKNYGPKGQVKLGNFLPGRFVVITLQQYRCCFPQNTFIRRRKRLQKIVEAIAKNFVLLFTAAEEKNTAEFMRTFLHW
jgi:hypothetical protein